MIRRSDNRTAIRRGNLSTWLSRHAQVLLASLGELVRYPLSNLMTVGVIGIALALPMGLHVVLQNILGLTSGWDEANQISLFLSTESSESDARGLEKKLRSMPEIKDVRYVSREAAFEEFRQFSGFGDALAALEENPLPAVLVVYPRRAATAPEAIEPFVDRLRALPAVETAQLDVLWVKRLYGIMEIGQRAVLVIGGLLALAVMLVVGNTIRLSIQNRRDEIEIIKLIGGTDAFIRRPFLYSGMWFGLFGGIVAWLLVGIAVILLGAPIQRLASLYGSGFELLGMDTGATLVLLGLGVGLGLSGSWLSVSRHLNAAEPV